MLKEKWKMKNVHDIEIEIKGKEWEQILDAAFQKRVKDMSIDGFRKGKCPKCAEENAFYNIDFIKEYLENENIEFENIKQRKK